MAMFEVIDNWTGKRVPRPRRDDLPEDEQRYYPQYIFWIIDDEGALYIANGKNGYMYDPPLGKYTVQIPQEK